MNKTTLSFFTLLLPFLLIGCSSNDSKSSTKGAKKVVKKHGFDQPGAVSVQKIDTPDGADKSVSAEDGGEGFTGEGWITRTPKQYGSPDAKKGGTLTLAFSNFPSTYRSLGKQSNQSIISTFSSLVYEGMLSFNSETMDYEPVLATHWKISDDKKTFHFRLNPNARWSNGAPVTSQDVVTSWKFRLDKGLEAPSTNSTYAKYEVSAVSKYIVKVTINEDDWKLFIWISQMSIYPHSHLSKVDGKGYLEKYQYQMLPGTGPYIMDPTDTKKDQQIVMRRRSDYWGANLSSNAGVNNFDRIKWIVVLDDVLKKEKFKKGEFDLYEVNRAQWWKQEFDPEDQKFDNLYRGLIQKKKSFNFTPKGHSGIVFNMRKAPFNDIRIRKAFAHLWNIEELNKTMFFNEYKQLTSVFPMSKYANPNNAVYPYDPQKAAKLLDEAGYNRRNKEGIRINKKGKPLEVDFPIGTWFERVITPYQADLKKAGIKLNLKITESNKLWQMGNERKFTMLYMGWTGMLFPNPETSIHSSLADKPNTNNFPGVKNKDIDKYIDLYNKEHDTQKRIEYLQNIDKILSETVHYAYGWGAPYSSRFAYWNKFGMPKTMVYPSGGADGAAMTLWWLDDEKEKKLEKAKNDTTITFPKEKIIHDYWKLLK